VAVVVATEVNVATVQVSPPPIVVVQRGSIYIVLTTITSTEGPCVGSKVGSKAPTVTYVGQELVVGCVL